MCRGKQPGAPPVCVASPSLCGDGWTLSTAGLHLFRARPGHSLRGARSLSRGVFVPCGLRLDGVAVPQKRNPRGKVGRETLAGGGSNLKGLAGRDHFESHFDEQSNNALSALF